MSMEIHVLSDKKLPSASAWQNAIEAEGYDLVLDPEAEFDLMNGFMPATLRGAPSGFEGYHDDVQEVMEAYADMPYFQSCPAWSHVLSLRWGGVFHEALSACMAAVAYAKATGGVIYEPQAGRALTLDEARELVHEFETLAR